MNSGLFFPPLEFHALVVDRHFTVGKEERSGKPDVTTAQLLPGPVTLHPPHFLGLAFSIWKLSGWDGYLRESQGRGGEQITHTSQPGLTASVTTRAVS